MASRLLLVLLLSSWTVALAVLEVDAMGEADVDGSVPLSLLLLLLMLLLLVVLVVMGGSVNPSARDRMVGGGSGGNRMDVRVGAELLLRLALSPPPSLPLLSVSRGINCDLRNAITWDR